MFYWTYRLSEQRTVLIPRRQSALDISLCTDVPYKH